MTLQPNHNPARNSQLIHSYFERSPAFLKDAAESCKLLRKEADKWTAPKQTKNFLNPVKKLWTHTNETVQFHSWSGEGNDLWPDWKPVLDKEYEKLQKQAADVYYAVPGDDIQSVLNGGCKTVCLAEGTYLVNELKLSSYTILKGAGRGKTIIKLPPHAPKRSFVVTNKNHIRGNHHISVEEVTLDWSSEKLSDGEKSSSGNNRSSCLTFANVTYGWIKNCQGLNPGLHCFDVSSTLYDYSGDGHRARGGSRFVWIDGCTGSGFGDDGVTTHHSEYIFISNCFMCDPSGRSHKKGAANSNGFEVDDGSRSVWLVNNASARCFGGVEVKAHATSSAAANVHIAGHLSERDNRSFNFRHIGHHKAGDPDSATARFLTATRLVSLYPEYTSLYPSSKPRALTVSAYQCVVVNGLRAIGHSGYDYKQLPVAGVQFKAKHVYIQNVVMKDFPSAGAALRVFGGANRAVDVTVRDTSFINCGSEPLQVDEET